MIRSVQGDVMALFWIVHEIDGMFVEAHMRDAKTARKVPKKMIGRPLSPREVSALLKRLS